jgi:uncharacterized membrane protein
MTTKLITINVPLIFKMRDFIFCLRANYFVGHFKRYFDGAKTFLTPKLSSISAVVTYATLFNRALHAITLFSGTSLVLVFNHFNKLVRSFSALIFGPISF